MEECGKRIVMGAVIVDVEEEEGAIGAMESYCCDVRGGNGDLELYISGYIGLDEEDGSGVWRVSKEVCGGVKNPPMGGASCIIEGVEPGLLDHNDIPVCQVGCVKYVLMCIS